MKKSLSMETLFGEEAFYDRFRRAGQAGHGYVEFGRWTELDLTRVKDALAENKLRLASLEGGMEPALGDAARQGFFLEHLSQSIAVGIFLSCSNVMLEGGFALPPGATGAGEGLENAKRLLQSAAEKAARSGVTLYLKPHPDRGGDGSAATLAAAFAAAAGKAAELLRAVATPALRLALDFGHLPAVSPADADALVKMAERFRDILGYIQLGDANLPCLGDLGRGLRERLGYDGFVGFCLHGGEGTPERLQAMRDF